MYQTPSLDFFTLKKSMDIKIVLRQMFAIYVGYGTDKNRISEVLCAPIFSLAIDWLRVIRNSFRALKEVLNSVWKCFKEFLSNMEENSKFSHFCPYYIDLWP